MLTRGISIARQQAAARAACNVRGEDVAIKTASTLRAGV